MSDIREDAVMLPLGRCGGLRRLAAPRQLPCTSIDHFEDGEYQQCSGWPFTANRPPTYRCANY